MDFNSTIDLIIKDLNEASEIIDDLKKYPGVPALQVELAKSKCRSAGDVIALLKSLSINKPADVALSTEEHIPKVPDEKKPADTTMLADKFTQSSDLYSEQSAGIKPEKDLSDHLKVKTIKNLSDAIGISDKFLFIGAIFDGNKEAYLQAISRLDKAENIQDAMAIIMSYTGENTESEAVTQLIELVKLKLPSNE
jgi:hypothetical protein